MFQQKSPELKLELQHELQHPPQASHAARGALRAPASPLRKFTAPPPDDELSNLDQIDLSTPAPVTVTALAPAPIQLPPSALTSHATAYDPHSDAPSLLEDFPRAGRGHGHSSHQRTLTGTLLNNSQSFLTRATSTIQQHTSAASIRSHSPSKSLASFIP